MTAIELLHNIDKIKFLKEELEYHADLLDQLFHEINRDISKAQTQINNVKYKFLTEDKDIIDQMDKIYDILDEIKTKNDKNVDKAADKLDYASGIAARMYTNMHRCQNLKTPVTCKRCTYNQGTFVDGVEVHECVRHGAPFLIDPENDYCSYGELEPEQLCWNCANFCDGCEWARSKGTTPVEGWRAIRKALDHDITYLVLACPEFVDDGSGITNSTHPEGDKND